MRRHSRLACFAATALSFCVPGIAAACSIVPTPAPPPQAAEESDEAFAARSKAWYREIGERERREALPRWTAHEDRLWATARWVVLARIEKVRSTRLRGSGRQWFESELVTLRTIRWLKGRAVAKRVRIHALSNDSCKFGGAGAALEGDVGEVFLLFYRSGPLGPLNLIDSFDKHGIVTARSREAFAEPEG